MVFGMECLCYIRPKSLYDERSVNLALYIIITLIYINKIHQDCRPSQTKEYGGIGLHKRERGIRD
jgi:hypothetical protein